MTRTALLAIAAAALAWMGPTIAGCEGDIGFGFATPTGGGASTTPSTSTSAGGGSGLACVEPAGDLCDEPEDCACALCEPAALCQPDGEGCIVDWWCLALEDACTCSDCDFAGRCFAGHVDQCDGDGTCQFEREGCGCPDCWDATTCRDNAFACEGGAPDGICDPVMEDCACNDCLGGLECLCPDPLECPWNACICPGCWTDEWCNAPEDCVDDGLCAWDEWEGCHCADCAAQPYCAGYPGSWP